MTLSSVDWTPENENGDRVSGYLHDDGSPAGCADCPNPDSRVTLCASCGEDAADGRQTP